MPARAPYTNIALVRRSVLPSAASLVACVGCSILLIAAHLLLLSVADGTALPMIFDGEWATQYTNTIVRPLDVLLNNHTFNSFLTVVVWGFLGLCVYSLVEIVVRIYKDAKEAQRDVQVTNWRVVPHPERKAFVEAIVWRTGIFILVAIFLVAVQPVLRYLLAGDAKLVEGTLGLPQSLRQLGLAFAGWALLAHCFVVFLRLFVMRTRLFGEALY